MTLVRATNVVNVVSTQLLGFSYMYNLVICVPRLWVRVTVQESLWCFASNCCILQVQGQDVQVDHQDRAQVGPGV